jgi:hypothetical protein
MRRLALQEKCANRFFWIHARTLQRRGAEDKSLECSRNKSLYGVADPGDECMMEPFLSSGDIGEIEDSDHG